VRGDLAQWKYVSVREAVKAVSENYFQPVECGRPNCHECFE